MDRALCPVLVGRDRELNLLEDALLEAHRGQGQVVAIGGEAGVGKTRLARELQERARRARTAVMVGTTTESDVSLPYLPFIEAIGNFLAGADLDRIKLQLGPANCRQLGQLLPQFELQTTLIDPGEPAQAKLRLYEAILALLRLLALVQGWQRSGIAQLIQLQPLAAGDVARMVSAIFDNAPVEVELRDFLHRRTEGNPFVLEELLKAALDHGDIYLTAGG